jgi:hypothetical protein
MNPIVVMGFKCKEMDQMAYYKENAVMELMVHAKAAKFIKCVASVPMQELPKELHLDPAS